MSNPIYYLAGLVLALSYPTGLEPLEFARRPGWPWALGAALAVMGAFSWWVHATLLGRGLAPRIPQARLLLRVTALLLYAMLVYIFHVPYWMDLWMGGEEGAASLFLSIAPLLGLFGVQAAVGAHFEPALRGTGVTSRGALVFAARSFVALSLIPILLMSLLDLIPQRIEAVRRLSFIYPFLGWVVLVVPMMGLLGVLPVLLRFALGAKSLPTGPVRERMEKLCRSVGFSCGDLLVVSTSGLRLANAFIVGLIPAWRYVFFTDEILRGMNPVELECVLAHEIVHSKKGHILSFFYMVLGFALSNALTVDLMERAKFAPALLLVTMLAWAGFFWVVVFGFVSRRFETEADLVAARIATPWNGGTGGYPAAKGMAGALETVAWLNHMPLRAWSWRHFDIATRIRILLDAESNPALGRSFEGLCARLRMGAVALVGVGLMCGALVCVNQLDRADRNRSILLAYDRLERGRTLAREGKYEEAAAELGQGLETVREDCRGWLILAECERALGHSQAARKAEDQARGLHPADPGLRLQLAR